jgi:hypothetical protein
MSLNDARKLIQALCGDLKQLIQDLVRTNSVAIRQAGMKCRHNRCFRVSSGCAANGGGVAGYRSGMGKRMICLRRILAVNACRDC